MAANDYALIVGITNYPRLKNLKGPENDARGFREWLVSPEGGCVPPENITLIVSSECFDPDETDTAKMMPSTGQIDAAFERLIEKAMAKNGRLGRRLYIYMAGHGFSVKTDFEETAVLMANASRLSTGHHIPGIRYANWFRTAAVFEEIVLLIDACREEFQLPTLRFPPFMPLVSAAAGDVRIFYAFATRSGRKARERRIAPGGQVEGLFTHAVLTALKKTPPDENGRVSGARLRDYIFNIFHTLVTGEERQEPEIRVEPERDIIFFEREPEQPMESLQTLVRIHFNNPDPAHSAAILNSELNRVDKVIGIPPVWEVSLVSGFYKVIVFETSEEQRFNVTGEEVLDVSL